jgi:hypothetical protein
MRHAPAASEFRLCAPSPDGEDRNVPDAAERTTLKRSFPAAPDALRTLSLAGGAGGKRRHVAAPGHAPPEVRTVNNGSHPRQSSAGNQPFVNLSGKYRHNLGTSARCGATVVGVYPGWPVGYLERTRTDEQEAFMSTLSSTCVAVCIAGLSVTAMAGSKADPPTPHP